MKRFLHSRATIDRLSEGSVWHGWVDSIDNLEVRIRANDPPSMMAMEVCELHLATARYRADFKVDFKFKMGQIAAFSMPPRVRMEKSDDPFRVQVPRLAGSVRAPLGVVPIQVLDASPGGLGFEIEQPIDPGILVDVGFDSCCGEIEASGQIIYCASGGENRPCRAGLKIHSINRISRARLDQLLGATAA